MISYIFLIVLKKCKKIYTYTLFETRNLSFNSIPGSIAGNQRNLYTLILCNDPLRCRLTVWHYIQLSWSVCTEQVDSVVLSTFKHQTPMRPVFSSISTALL